MENKKNFFQKLVQNNNSDIYIWKMNIVDLYRIHRVSFLSEDDFENSNFNEQVEIAINDTFEAKQRDESPERVRSISKYINSDLWIFPNSIILGNLKWCDWLKFIENHDNGFFELELNIKSELDKLFVIDWQHRLKWVALNYYDNILVKLEEYFLNDSEKIFNLNSIKKISLPIKKIDSIIDFIEKNSDDNIIKIIKWEKKFELIVVIINELSNSKMIEIFTDINWLVKPLKSNIIRFNYWYFTNKRPPDFDLLNISVNIWKLLTENRYSPLYWLIKMPYPSTHYKENLNWYSQLSLSAFCQRFEERWKIDIKNYKFYNKALWLFIYHRFLSWEINQKLPIDEKSIIESINFLFFIFSYTYAQIKNTFDFWIESELKKYNNVEKKDFKFISSTSNELYFYIIENILLIIINKNNFDIDNIIKFNKESIKSNINEVFPILKQSIINIFNKNKYFLKWTQDWSWWDKSRKIVKSFEKDLKDNSKENLELDTLENIKVNFDDKIKQYYKKE